MEPTMIRNSLISFHKQTYQHDFSCNPVSKYLALASELVWLDQFCGGMNINWTSKLLDWCRVDLILVKTFSWAKSHFLAFSKPLSNQYHPNACLTNLMEAISMETGKLNRSYSTQLNSRCKDEEMRWDEICFNQHERHTNCIFKTRKICNDGKKDNQHQRNIFKIWKWSQKR